MMADLVPEHMNVMQQFLSLKLAKDQLLMGIWVCLSMKLCHSMSRHLNAAGGKVRGVCKLVKSAKIMLSVMFQTKANIDYTLFYEDD